MMIVSIALLAVLLVVAVLGFNTLRDAMRDLQQSMADLHEAVHRADGPSRPYGGGSGGNPPGNP